MMRISIVALSLAFWAAVGYGQSGPSERIPLSANQIQQLNIQTQVLPEHSAASYGGLAAQVVIPTARVRVVSTPLAGLVESLRVAPGMKVQTGQMLAQLSSREALELGRDWRQSRAQAQLTQQTLRRDEQLFQEGLIPEARVQQSRSQHAQAEAAANERRASLNWAGVGEQAPSLRLSAPISGVVLEQYAQVGQRLEANSPVYKVAQLSPLWLEIQVPTELAPSLKEGMLVRAGEASGKLLAVAQAVSSDSQTITVRALLHSQTHTLRPGQALSAEIAMSGKQMRIPRSAIVQAQQRTVVFVKNKDQSFTPQTVSLGSSSAQMVEVSGLTPGMEIVTNGVSALKAIWTGVGRE